MHKVILTLETNKPLDAVSWQYCGLFFIANNSMYLNTGSHEEVYFCIRDRTVEHKEPQIASIYDLHLYDTYNTNRIVIVV